MTTNELSQLPRNVAVISACGCFRYYLARRIAAGDRVATFIMLNPSTADAFVDDPTVRKCQGFARRWGCSLLRVVNLFAVRATNPVAIKAAADPVGPDNKAWVNAALGASVSGRDRVNTVVCAWGVHGSF